MNRVASQLRALRTGAGLSVEQLAEQLDLDAGALRAAEVGDAILPPQAIARCATLVGLEPDEWLRGAPLDGAPIALLRGAAEAGTGALRGLHDDRVPMLSGEVLHRARMVQKLEGALGIHRARLPAVARGPLGDGAHPAEEDARRAREALGLGRGPVASMRAALESHGVLIVWADDDEVPETLDGLSLLGPVPTVLVNLRHGRETWWHTRMTLAHELGHLLFDHLRRGVAMMHSPSRFARAASWVGLEDIERDANAFAACLLAPSLLVRELVGAREPECEAAIAAVGAGCGVGRLVAINRLQDVFRLSDAARAEMTVRTVRRYEAIGRDDVPGDDAVGLRRGVFRARVVEALARGLLSRERAWSLLALSPDEGLPEAPTEALRAPLLSPEMLALRLARRVLIANSPWSPVRAEALTEGRWAVTVVRGVGAPPIASATLTLSAQGNVIDADVALDGSLRASPPPTGAHPAGGGNG